MEAFEDDDDEGFEIGIEGSDSSIKIGDLISLVITRSGTDGEAFLCGGGILDDIVEVAVEPSVFDDCVFQVCLRNRLSASIEMEAYQEQRAREEEEVASGARPPPSEDDEISARNFLATLERVKKNEGHLNTTLFADKCGTPIKFGDVIQLRHVKSGSWLTVCPVQVASTERENLRVSLHPEGTTFSWFTVVPSVTVDEEGMEVENLSHVILGVTDRTDEYLHCSADPMIKAEGMGLPGALEANCSLDSSPWRMMLFTEFEPPESPGVIGGQLISLLDAESNTVLRFLSEKEKAALPKEERQFADQPFFQPCAMDASEPEVHSGGLWVVEQMTMQYGGPVTWEGRYALRNLNTGMYLGCSLDKLPAALMSADAISRATFFASREPSALSFTPFAKASGPNVEAMAAVQLSSRRAWLSNGAWIEGAGSMCCASVVDDKSRALVLKIVETSGAMIKDSRVALTARPHLARFLRVCRDRDVGRFVALFPTIRDVISEMQNFVLDGEKTDLEGGVIVAIPNRQRMMRDQGTIDALVDCLRAIFPMVKRAKTKKGALELGEDAVETLKQFGKLCFETLRYSIRDNALNQLYLADNFKVLVGFLDTSHLAMQCINEMLDHNLDVQEKKIGFEVLNLFIDMMRESSMNYTILSVLRAICSCQGRGIDSNQTMLATLLLIKGQDLLVQLRDNGEVAGRDIKALCPGEPNEVSLDHVHGRAEKYLIAQLSTFAEMCFDRNYIAMSILQEMLPYSTLLAVTRSHDIAWGMKAACVNLINTLYVDCKPQEAFRFGNLAFAWSAVMDDVSLPAPRRASENDTDNFRDLKGLVAGHMAGLSKEKWTPLTQQLMKLLPSLISFKFYTSEEELQGLVGPLVHALDPNGAKARAERRAAARRGGGGDAASSTALGATTKLASFGVDVMDGTTKEKNTSQLSSAGDGSLDDEEDGGGGDGGDGGGERFYDKGSPPFFRRICCCLPQKPEFVRRSLKQQATLDVLEGFRMLVIMLSLVFFSIVVSVIGEVQGNGDALGYTIFDMVTFVIFLAEMTTRMWALNSMAAFFTDGFCLVDFSVVTLDIVTIAAKSALGSAGGFTKALRAIRLARLARVLRAARLISKLAAIYKGPAALIVWMPPPRFISTPDTKMQTMVQMVRVLRQISSLAHTFRLWTLVSKLKQYHEGGLRVPGEKDEVAVPRIFEESIASGNPISLAQVDESGQQVDEMLLDLCLHRNSVLVQEALQLLMGHHSASQHIVNDISKAQLLMGPLERQYLELEKKVSLLQYHIETQELWGHLEKEEHRQSSDEVKQVLRDLTAACRLEVVTLPVCSTVVHTANVEVQIMLRSLGLFDVCMEAMALSAELDNEDDAEDDEAMGEDGDDDFNPEESRNTREILQLTSSLLCWFVHHNPVNQALAHEEFPTFLEEIGADIGTSQVIVEILRDNEKLIKQVSESFIRVATNQIVKKGRVPTYLDLLDVLTHIGEYGLRDNQIEVVKQLTSPDIAEHVLALPGPPDSLAHQEHMELQRQYRDTAQAAKNELAVKLLAEVGALSPQEQTAKALDAAKRTTGTLLGAAPGDAEYSAIIESGLVENWHLPQELQYHVRLLNTLSGCAAGMINIVEAKVQSLSDFEDTLREMIDADTVIEVRAALARFFYDVVVDVQILVPGLCESTLWWEYVGTFPEWIKLVPQLAEDVIAAGVASPAVATHRQQLSYVFDCIIPNLNFFFKNYYAQSAVPRTAEWTEDVCARIYNAVLTVHLSRLPFIGEEHEELLMETMRNMHNVMGEDVVGKLPNIEEEKRRQLAMRRRMSASSRAQNDDDTKRGEALVDADTAAVREVFAGFTERICAADAVKSMVADEVSNLIVFFKRIPRIAEAAKRTDLRYEPLLKALVDHIGSCMVTEARKRRMRTKREAETATWLIRFFRRMIEYEWGFTIDDRDDDGDDDSDAAVEPVQLALDAAGATTLCLDLIANGIDPQLQLEAVKLLVALLYREGGHVHVQESINRHLAETKSDLFFLCVQEQLQAITNYFCDDEAGPPADDDDDDGGGGGGGGGGGDEDDDSDEDEPLRPTDGDVEVKEMLILVRMLQLCSEGHYLPNQDIVREQNNSATINLLDDMVAHLSRVSSLPKSAARTESLMAFADTILEVVQGPCAGNQEHLAINTELVEVLNRLMRARVEVNDCEEEDELDLKVVVLCIFKGLTEGQRSPSIIFDRILSVIHIDALQMLVLPRLGAAVTDELTDLQVQTLVVIQVLSNYDPHLNDDLHLPKAIMAKMGTQVLSIEVNWNGDLQRRFFPVPDTATKISDAAKDYLVEQVDRSNPELKLLDFVQRSRDIFVELKHEDQLQQLGLAGIFNRNVQNNATWIAFFICCFVNVLLIAESRDQGPGCPKAEQETFGGCVTISPGLDAAKKPEGWFSWLIWWVGENMAGGGSAVDLTSFLAFINVIQLAFSVFTFVLFVVVRVPVKYQLTRAKGLDVVSSAITASTDAATVYYGIYCVICALAWKVSSFFSSLLLIDIVMKNSTTRDVLLAVSIPFKQLSATFILATFTIYIFAFFFVSGGSQRR